MTKQNRSAVVVLSGGLDSSVLAFWARSKGYAPLTALTVLYGQRHIRELESARAIASVLGVPHEVVDLSGAAELFKGSALTTDGGDIPHGHYAAESMKATVVPNRNMVLLSLGIALAVREKAKEVFYGAHAGDHTIYPDCRPEFYAAMKQAASLADWHTVHLHAPFINMTKAQVAALGATLNVPLGLTWSCYEGGTTHCGRCGTCTERREAFTLAQVEDPTEYTVAA